MSWLLRKRASSVGSIASTSTDASSPSDNHELQASVIKATRPMTNPAAPNELNADPHGLEEIAEQARGNRKGFVNDLVKMLKARLKSEDEKVVLLAIGVFDQCMQECGYDFQLQVAKKALERMGKLSVPGQAPTAVQMLAAETVLKWGSLYGDKDKGFKKAAQAVTDRETKMLQDEFKAQYNDVKERVKAMKVAQKADIEELQQAMKEMGITPKTTESQEALQKQPIPLLLARAGEASDMLEALMSSSTPEELNSNSDAHEQVISCLKYQTHIDIVEPRIRDAATKAQAERTLTELTKRIEAFLVATSGGDHDHDHHEAGRPPDVDPSNGEVAARLKTVKKIIRQRLAKPPTLPPPPAPSLPAASAPASRTPPRPSAYTSGRNEIEPRGSFSGHETDTHTDAHKQTIVHMPEGKYPYDRPPPTAPTYTPPKNTSTPPPFNPYHSSPAAQAAASPYAGSGAVSSSFSSGHAGATSYAVKVPKPPRPDQDEAYKQGWWTKEEDK